MSAAILRSVASSGVHVRPITRPDHVETTATLTVVPPLETGQQQALDLGFRPHDPSFRSSFTHPLPLVWGHARLSRGNRPTSLMSSSNDSRQLAANFRNPARGHADTGRPG